MVLVGQKRIRLTNNLHPSPARPHDGSVQVHGLEVKGFVTVRNDGIKAAYFRGEHEGPVKAADDAGPEFFTVLNHEEGLVGKASDDTIGTVDDQIPS